MLSVAHNARYGTNCQTQDQGNFCDNKRTISFGLRSNVRPMASAVIKRLHRLHTVAPSTQQAPCGQCRGSLLRPKAIHRDSHGARPVALELRAPARCRPAPSGAADPAAAPAPGAAPSRAAPAESARLSLPPSRIASLVGEGLAPATAPATAPSLVPGALAGLLIARANVSSSVLEQTRVRSRQFAKCTRPEQSQHSALGQVKESSLIVSPQRQQMLPTSFSPSGSHSGPESESTSDPLMDPLTPLSGSGSTMIIG